MNNQIQKRLVEKGQLLVKKPSEATIFTKKEDIDRLVNDLKDHPHAFVIGCLMDRQVRAEIAWSVPYRLKERLGSFSFDSLKLLTKDEIRKLMTKPEPLHRFPDKMADDLYEAIRYLKDNYDGIASRIWENRPSSAEVVYRFLRIKGIGQKIATMATNILARYFKIAFSDYYSIDISVDRHVKRVFLRLGLVPSDATNEEIVFRARALHPEFPGLIDEPCWEIGHNWCRPSNRRCSECYMNDLCPSVQNKVDSE